MSVPANQVQQDALNKQIQNQKVLRGLTVGMQFLEDKEVSGPTHYFEGLADLKWLLRLLLSGQAAINFAPLEQPGAAGQAPSESAQRIAATPLDDGQKGGEGSGGNGSRSPK